jgi:GntR family transcriptional regulator
LEAAVSERRDLSFSGPLHEQVLKRLRARILAGEWEPREPLPGEALLSRELGVSVGTVRKAMDQLTREHIVVRERGRGTFVRGGTGWRSGSLLSLCDHEGQTITPRIKLVEANVADATAGEIKALKLRSNPRFSARVLRLRRDWKAGDVLLCRERIVVEEPRFPELLREMDERAADLFSTYDETYRIKVDGIHWAIGTSDLCFPIEGEASTCEPALPMRRTAFDARGVPVELCELQVHLAKCLVHICC